MTDDDEEILLTTELQYCFGMNLVVLMVKVKDVIGISVGLVAIYMCKTWPKAPVYSAVVQVLPFW